MKRNVIRPQSGFTLIEALVALLVMSFGMLAIAGMQITLTRGADVAKQRSEAVRIAQLKIEELRSFETVASDATKYDYQNEVVGGNDVLAPDVNNPSNVSYTRTWTVTRDGVNAASPTELQKWINVTVEWADRTSTVLNQSVTLRTVISRADPVDLGTLFTGPGGSKTRTPKNRNINIPYPAKDLGNNKSGFTPPPLVGTFYVFDNTTGEITKICTGDLATLDPSFDPETSAACTDKFALLLSGYIRFLNSVPTSGNEKNIDDGITNPTDATRELTAQVVFLSPTPTSQPQDCFAQRQRVVRKNSTGDEVTIPEGTTPPSGYNTLVSTFVAYTCIIEPHDHDSDTATAKRWSGQFTITTDGTWTLGTGAGNYKMCRFSGDYISDNAISNSEHPLYYRSVTGALDHQNYIVVPHTQPCPNDDEAAPLISDYVNTNTVQHQNAAVATGTQPYGGSFSQGTQWGTGSSGEQGSESEFPML